MVPTNRLRQVGIYLIVPHQSEENMCDRELTGYKLQQWWSNPNYGNHSMPMSDHEGEWRDVEIVEE